MSLTLVTDTRNSCPVDDAFTIPVEDVISWTDWLWQEAGRLERSGNRYKHRLAGVLSDMARTCEAHKVETVDEYETLLDRMAAEQGELARKASAYIPFGDEARRVAEFDRAERQWHPSPPTPWSL